MPTSLNLVGKKFGRLTVIEKCLNHPGRVHWLCQCDCGSEPKKIRGDSLTGEKTKSCGNCLTYNSDYGKRICELCEKEYQIKDKAWTRKYCYDCTPSVNKKDMSTMVEYASIARKNKRRKLIKLNGTKCQYCGYDNYTGSLCFHHEDPQQKDFPLTVANMNKAFELLKDEARKCILLCKNCHMELHELESFNSQLKSHIPTLKLRHQRKKDLIKIMGGKCILCNYDKSMRALEFHHINAEEKEFLISDYNDLDSILQEIRKCALLCANCHGEVHAGLVKQENIYCSFNENFLIDKN